MTDKKIGQKQNVIEREVQRLMEEAGENGYLSENIMARLRDKYNDQELLDQIQESYMKLLDIKKKELKIC